MQEGGGDPKHDAPAAEPGRRERKKRQTRDALIDAASELFSTKGYRDTRITEIADAADVSDATFFRYFATKEDVAIAPLKARIDDVVSAVEHRPVEESPLTACLAVVDTAGALNLAPTKKQTKEVQVLAENPNLVAHFFWHVSLVTQQLSADFARRLDLTPSDLEPRLLANAVVSTINAVFQVWLSDPRHVDPIALTREGLHRLAVGFEPDLPAAAPMSASPRRSKR